jgi:hypothetical protein
MLQHLVRTTVIAILLVACMFLPFRPGQHDPAAILLSNIAQMIGFAGFLLVPIGAVWLAFGRLERRALRAACAVAASVVITLAFIAGAVGNNSLHLALVFLLVGAYFSFWFVRCVWRNEAGRRIDPVAISLVVIPMIILAARFAFIGQAIEFSRNRVIENSRPLINDIEAFYARNGHYPESLHSEWEDYKPGIVGVGRYYYEPHGKAYNLFFEQYSDQIGTREFVMYNPLGEHQMSAHNSDRLRYSIADQRRMWGWHRVVQLPQENWKYFHFD